MIMGKIIVFIAKRRAKQQIHVTHWDIFPEGTEGHHKKNTIDWL